MKKRSIAVLSFLMTISVYGQTQKETIRLADPTIFCDKGTYYLYGTGRPDGFPVYTSTDLHNWQLYKRNALLKGDSYGTTGFWAPQVFRHDGKYYMAYTANEHIAIAESDRQNGRSRRVQRPPSFDCQSPGVVLSLFQ